jgi:asparagine synthase (glutamine-hydrolysing)
VKIYFSFLPDLAALRLVELSINWTFVARMFLKLMQSHATGCNEVSEVLCGERIELERNLAERRTKFWNPLEVIQARRIDDPMQAAAAVRSVTRSCVHAWASLHPNIVHLLSGGLDSSIVLSCLNDARTAGTITCINRFSPGADGDERSYARLVASATGRRLVEAQRSADFNIDELCNVRLSERPQGYLALLGQSHSEMQLAREVGASAIFGGRFGDQVFYSSDLALSCADYVSDVGLRPGLIPVASSAARAANSSFWRVMKLALKKGMVRSSVNPNIPVLRPNSLVNAPVLLRLQDLRAEDLPYSDSARGADSSCYIPPGKQLHVLSLATPDGCYVPNYSEADAQYVSPLLSQPLVELCLQIPTYVLTSGGWDRAVARNAFARDLPTEIVRRRSKGGQAQHTAEIFQRHRAFLRDLLLNGELVRADILDRARVAEAFAKGSSNLFHGPARLSRFVNMELWLAIFRQHTVQKHGVRDAAMRRAS